MITKNNLNFFTFIFTFIITCANASPKIAQEIAQIAKKEGYTMSSIPMLDAPQEEWDLFVDNIANQFMNRATKGRKEIANLLEKYFVFKDLSFLKNQIAEFALSQGYEIKSMPTEDSSQKIWDTFVEAVSQQNVRVPKLEESPLDDILNKYFDLKKRIDNF